MRTRFSILVAALATGGLLWTGCGALDPDPEAAEYRSAVPTSAELALEVPAGVSQSAAGQKTFGLIGQRAEMYQRTRDTTRSLNGAVWVGLHIVGDIVKHPPSSVQNGIATWGPYTPPLEPLTWLLVVRKEQLPGHYSYLLAARPKGASTADQFKAVLAGSSRKGIGGFVGVYAASATALNQLDPQGHPATGKLAAAYDTRLGRRVVHLALTGFSEDGGEPVDLAYRYRVLHSGAGLFRFIARADVQGNGSAEETVAMATQWDATGAGRGDALVSGGDVPGNFVIHMTECWDDGFGRTFYQDNAQINPTEGDPAQCVFGAPPADESGEDELDPSQAPELPDSVQP